MGKISVDCIAPTIVIANKLIGLPATDHEFGCHNNASGGVMLLENQDFFSPKKKTYGLASGTDHRILAEHVL